MLAELGDADATGGRRPVEPRRAAGCSPIAAGPDGGRRLLGLLALADPLRADARAAVLAARAAGIRTVMITGDHLGTATAIAGEAGVVDPADPPD